MYCAPPPPTPRSRPCPTPARKRAHHIEGHRGGTWLLMDFSAVVVHVFTDEARKFYDLERLWSDAEEMDISEALMKD